MFKKLIIGLCLWLFATTLIFGANLQDGYSAYEKGDYKTAFIIFKDLAKKVDIEAQYNLGAMYSIGQDVRQDKKIAKEWFGKACDGGYQKDCDTYKILNQQGY